MKVGSTQATSREWLCATGSVQVGSARVCSAQCALHELRRAVSHESGLRKLHCSRLLPASALCKLLCASALSKLLCASALSKLLCASALRQLRMCSVQVGLCKLLCASALCKCSAELLFASCSAQVTLRKLLCASAAGAVGMYFAYFFWYLKVAIFQPELREHAPHTTFVLKSCDFPAGAAGARSAYYVCTEKLRFSSRSCRGPGKNRTRDRRIAKAGAQTTRQLPKVISRAKKSHGATARALRRTISAKGSLRLRRIRTAPQRERFDTCDPRKGFIRECQKRKKLRVFAPRPRRSPQRVARAPTKTQKPLSFCISTTPIFAEGRADVKKRLEFLHLDHADLRRGPRGHQQKRKKQPEFLHLDRADLRTGSCGNVKKRQKPGVFAPRPRRSPQRVARAPTKTQKTLSFCTLTAPISAEGRAGMSKNHEFLHLDHADLRRGSHSRSSATSPPPALQEILNTEHFLFLARALST